MRDELQQEIEAERNKLHAAVLHAGYDLHCQEVQEINMRLDALITLFMKISNNAMAASNP